MKIIPETGEVELKLSETMDSNNENGCIDFDRFYSPIFI
jgi:hypothetical protein